MHLHLDHLHVPIPLLPISPNSTRHLRPALEDPHHLHRTSHPRRAHPHQTPTPICPRIWMKVGVVGWTKSSRLRIAPLRIRVSARRRWSWVRGGRFRGHRSCLGKVLVRSFSLFTFIVSLLCEDFWCADEPAGRQGYKRVVSWATSRD